MVIFRYVNVYQRVRDKSPFWVLTSYRFYSVMVAAVLKQYFSVLGFGDNFTAMAALRYTKTLIDVAEESSAARARNARSHSTPPMNPRLCPRDAVFKCIQTYPLVMTNITMENHHLVREFSHETW